MAPPRRSPPRGSHSGTERARAGGNRLERPQTPPEPKEEEVDRSLSPQARYARLVAAGRSTNYRGHKSRHRVKEEPSPRAASPSLGPVSRTALPRHLPAQMAARGHPAAASSPTAGALPEASVVVETTQQVMDLLDVLLVNPSTHMSTLLTLYRRIRIAVEAREALERDHA